MTDPATALWGLRITDLDFNRLKRGFQPRDMDDKWVCLADEPDQDPMVVRWSRSWTGLQHVVLSVKRDTDGGGAVIKEITWEQGDREEKVTEVEGKALATNLCNIHLGCKWEAAT